ncbi:MAG: DinB family protein [Fulvivirga sp.]|nr:DinB family protein [Fulvivirga sp.]
MIQTRKLPEFYQRYIDKVGDEDLIPALMINGDKTLELIRSIDEEKGNYAYASGKWTIKEVIAHIIDSERIFAYRALRFSRNDQTPLPGFNEDNYVAESNAKNRKVFKLAEEFANLRASTVDLFSSFTHDMLKRSGAANELEKSVEVLGYIIVGHEIHHRQILSERYLS